MSIVVTETASPATAAPASPEQLEAKSQIDVMQKRLNDQGAMLQKVISQNETMLKQFTDLKPASSAKVGESEETDKPLTGVAALKAATEKYNAMMDSARQKTIRSTVVSAMVEGGVPEQLARKISDAMQKEAKFSVNEDTEEVMAEDGSGIRSASEFVKIMLQRDDWRLLIPAKAGAKPLPKGAAAPAQGAGVLLQPNQDGVYDGAAVRAAAGMT